METEPHDPLIWMNKDAQKAATLMTEKQQELYAFLLNYYKNQQELKLLEEHYDRH